ncbi:hypothetical protein LJC47_04565 [Desulfosarcina sp. OttesenSCG-928-B08]|nr:hypothetical protein [Desulfosarcina sp. OttesenSCG-928-B08]
MMKKSLVWPGMIIIVSVVLSPMALSGIETLLGDKIILIYTNIYEKVWALLDIALIMIFCFTGIGAVRYISLTFLELSRQKTNLILLVQLTILAFCMLFSFVSLQHKLQIVLLVTSLTPLSMPLLNIVISLIKSVLFYFFLLHIPLAAYLLFVAKKLRQESRTPAP